MRESRWRMERSQDVWPSTTRWYKRREAWTARKTRPTPAGMTSKAAHFCTKETSGTRHSGLQEEVRGNSQTLLQRPSHPSTASTHATMFMLKLKAERRFQSCSRAGGHDTCAAANIARTWKKSTPIERNARLTPFELRK